MQIENSLNIVCDYIWYSKMFELAQHQCNDVDYSTKKYQLQGSA